MRLLTNDCLIVSPLNAGARIKAMIDSAAASIIVTNAALIAKAQVVFAFNRARSQKT